MERKRFDITCNNNELRKQTSRYQGALIGLAVGDAIGTTLEFCRPGTFDPIDDMIGGGVYQLPPSCWTDDTSMALCLAESLVERQEFDPTDQMLRYLRWWREGYLSSTGYHFDIGNTVASALMRFDETGAPPFAGSSDPRTAGNGSLMRLAPIPLAFAAKPETAIHLAGEMSMTTHAARETVDACRYFSGLILGALRNTSKQQLLGPLFSPVPGLWSRKPLVSSVVTIASGSFKEKERTAIRGSGYVIESLEAALWAFHNSHSFEEGVLKAVNLGNDADTIGAIYGQLAGAFYGLEAIPEKWRNRIALKERISTLADDLLALCSKEESTHEQ